MAISTPSDAASELAGSTPELAFSVRGVEPLRHAVVPTLQFRIGIERSRGPAVRSIALNVQIRVAATRRAYDAATRDRLQELFGRGEQWARGLRSLPWTAATAQVPPFADDTVVELPVTCTYDFEVAVAKYFHGLDDGEIPLELLFSGTVFYGDERGRLQVALIPWEKEAEWRLPIHVWREMMELYFPNSAWLRIDRRSFDRLYAYRARNALPSWERTLDALLDEAEDR